MKFTEIKPAELPENELIVRFFGALELENKYGKLCENKSKPAGVVWHTLKYLLVNSIRDVEQTELELLELPGHEEKVPDGAMRTRLRRVRDLLIPLHMGGRNELLLYNDLKYSVNSDYVLRTDEDAFNAIMERLRSLPEDEPEGIELCAEALELCRGPYLSYSGDAKWVKGYQEFYKREFCALCEQTLRRMRALGDSSAAVLLWNRAVAVAPESEETNRAILGYLIEQKKELEVIRYVTHLTLKGARWLADFVY